MYLNFYFLHTLWLPLDVTKIFLIIIFYREFGKKIVFPLVGPFTIYFKLSIKFWNKLRIIFQLIDNIWVIIFFIRFSTIAWSRDTPFPGQLLENFSLDLQASSSLPSPSPQPHLRIHLHPHPHTSWGCWTWSNSTKDSLTPVLPSPALVLGDREKVQVLNDPSQAAPCPDQTLMEAMLVVCLSFCNARTTPWTWRVTSGWIHAPSPCLLCGRHIQPWKNPGKWQTLHLDCFGRKPTSS